MHIIYLYGREYIIKIYNNRPTISHTRVIGREYYGTCVRIITVVRMPTQNKEFPIPSVTK